MGLRHPNPRLVKVHRNYSVEEVARLFGLHKNTVRNWFKQGLTAVDDRRPILILGRELSRFLHERRQKARQTCGPGRIYCIACRAPKDPAGQMAECIPTGPGAGRSSAATAPSLRSRSSRVDTLFRLNDDKRGYPLVRS